MALHEPVYFHSRSHPSRKVSYLHLNAGAPHALLFCFGAASSSLMLNSFRPFVDSHPDLSLLCVDRWTLGEDAARIGPELFSELSEITLELLDVLHIQRFSIAAHSAGAYQLLDLAARAGVDRVPNLFMISTHIPAPYTNSKIMKWMCTMPEGLFKTVTTLDSSIGNTWAGRLVAALLTKEEDTNDMDNAFVPSKELQRLIREHTITEKNELDASDERRNIDYRMAYQRIEGITSDTLTRLYRNCSVKTIWFTTDGEVFFGPESVRRIVQDIGKTNWEVIVLPEGTHADIYFRSKVWERMYAEITATD